MDDSASTLITTEVRGHVLVIGLNRPEKMNAANLEMLQALSLAYGELDRDPKLRVGVVYGVGEHFSAGLDLPDVAPALLPTGALPLPTGGVDPWGVRTRQVKKPVVMAVQGICYTLGVELALASDVVIAEASARFAQLEVTRGIMPFGGATTRFPRAAGWSKAMRWLLTGEVFSAQTAHELGVVTEVVEAGALEKALDIAETISRQAPLAVQATLESARNGISGFHQEHEAFPARLGALLATEDVRRGMESFLAKRPADFLGD
jgi:enoyl-CoA hydratase